MPFLRGLAGPMDWTFGTFDFSNPNSPFSRCRTTIAKQLAQYVVIYSPLQMANDDPAAYEGVEQMTVVFKSCIKAICLSVPPDDIGIVRQIITVALHLPKNTNTTKTTKINA